MQTQTIKAFYNPGKDGKRFTGLFGNSKGWDGDCAEIMHANLPSFLKAARRDYYIKKVPVGVLDPNGAVDTAGNIVPAWREVENQFHLVRSNDHRVVSPHTVTDSYAPLSLLDIAEEVSPWVEAGWATPDAVFDAKDGSLEILALRLDAQGEITDGDFFVHYVVLQNPHGSGGKASGKIISFRIVCANTFAAAVSSASDFTITHRVASGSPEAQQAVMVKRAKDAVAAWAKVQEHIQELSRRINTWKNSPITFRDAEVLTDRLLEIQDLEKASGRAKNSRTGILAAFSMPKFGTFGQTAADWINAVTFENSSPNSGTVQKSKVGAIERAVRNMSPNGTGLKLEERAERVLAGFLA